MDTQVIKTFTAFLDLIEHPEKYKEMIDGLKKAKEEYIQAAVLAKDTAGLQEWKRDELIKFEKREKDLLFIQKKLDQREQALDARQGAIDQRETSISKTMTERRDALMAKELQLKGLEELMANVKLEQAKYEKALEALEVEKANLKKREEAIKAALR